MSMLADEAREGMREDAAARLNIRGWIVWLWRLVRVGA